MELRILDRVEFWISFDRFHFSKDATNILNVFFRSLLGCQTDVLHLKQRADLMQVIEADIPAPRAEEQIQRLHYFFATQCANGSADSVSGFQQSTRSKNANCFSNNSATDSQALRKFPFRREFCSNGQLFREDFVLYSMDDTVDQRILITYRSETNSSYFPDKWPWHSLLPIDSHHSFFPSEVKAAGVGLAHSVGLLYHDRRPVSGV